jgi:hypothetical protein
MEYITTIQIDQSYLNNPIYTYRGKNYEILSSIANRDGDTQRANQLLSDFLYCEEKKDWDTITNRIYNGLKWGWLMEIENYGLERIKTDEFR